MRADSLQHPLLSNQRIDHGFGTRGSGRNPESVCPRQVHGTEVAVLDSTGRLSLCDADAVVCRSSGFRIGVVTADCVPVLAAVGSGSAVAAIHAGWRGLAAGVVERAVDELLAEKKGDADRVAVIGPHIGPCCYEVDTPVIDALAARYGDEVEAASRDSRPGHVWLDLGQLVTVALLGAGFEAAGVGRIPDGCTSCHTERYHSFRRDGTRSGRMLHHIAIREPA